MIGIRRTLVIALSNLNQFRANLALCAIISLKAISRKNIWQQTKNKKIRNYNYNRDYDCDDTSYLQKLLLIYRQIIYRLSYILIAPLMKRDDNRVTDMKKVHSTVVCSKRFHNRERVELGEIFFVRKIKKKKKRKGKNRKRRKNAFSSLNVEIITIIIFINLIIFILRTLRTSQTDHSARCVAIFSRFVNPQFSCRVII